MKFEVDFMLGKLAKTLRMLGFDTKYAKYAGSSHSHFLHSEAMKEGRILLTRTHNLPKTPNVLIIESDHLEPQLKEVDAKFNIKAKIQPFTRCLICNTELTSVHKSEAKGKVPFYVYQTQDEFAYCSQCNKFYWKGSHYKYMVEKIKKIIDFS